MQAHVPHSKARVCSHLCVDSELTPHLQGEKQGEEAQEYEVSNLQELQYTVSPKTPENSINFYIET